MKKRRRISLNSMVILYLATEHMVISEGILSFVMHTQQLTFGERYVFALRCRRSEEHLLFSFLLCAEFKYIVPSSWARLASQMPAFFRYCRNALCAVITHILWGDREVDPHANRQGSRWIGKNWHTYPKWVQSVRNQFRAFSVSTQLGAKSKAKKKPIKLDMISKKWN